MNPKADLIGQIVFALAEYYDKTLTDLQMEMYVEDLMELDPQELQQAVKLYRNDSRNKFFPLPATLKGMLKPSDDQQAREAVSRIIYALRKYSDPYGHSAERIAAAMDYIGELGWFVVKRMGGWVHLSNADQEDTGPIAQAQWRELAISIQARDRLGIMNEAPRLPSSQGKTLQVEAKPDLEKQQVLEDKTTNKPNLGLFRTVPTLRKRELTPKELTDRQEFLRSQLKEIGKK